jgi:hypothetical protein
MFKINFSASLGIYRAVLRTHRIIVPIFVEKVMHFYELK